MRTTHIPASPPAADPSWTSGRPGSSRGCPNLIHQRFPFRGTEVTVR